MSFDPYCGPAPLPANLWSTWNLDPVLLVLLAGLGLVVWTRPAIPRNQRLVQSAGVLVLAIAFVSPLCALSTALFLARILHHLLLVAAAAPLLVGLLPARLRAAGAWPTAAFVVHMAVLWAWHAPGPYGWALKGVLPYWIMELTLIASALWLWLAIARSGSAGGIALLLATVVQMGMLGALLTFAPRPLFEPHLLTTIPFGLSPLQDQQLAGLLMWVPAALPYVAVALLRVAGALSPSGTSTSSGEGAAWSRG
jgi:putative membrane protein